MSNLSVIKFPIAGSDGLVGAIISKVTPQCSLLRSFHTCGIKALAVDPNPGFISFPPSSSPFPPRPPHSHLIPHPLVVYPNLDTSLIATAGPDGVKLINFRRRQVCSVFSRPLSLSLLSLSTSRTLIYHRCSLNGPSGQLRHACTGSMPVWQGLTSWWGIKTDQ